MKTLEVRVSELESELRSNVHPLNKEEKDDDENMTESQVYNRQLVEECGQLRVKLQKAQETNVRLEVQVVELAHQVAELQERSPEMMNQSSDADEKKAPFPQGQGQPCPGCVSLEVQLAMLKRQMEEQKQKQQFNLITVHDCSSAEERMISSSEDVQDNPNADSKRSVRFSDIEDYTINIESNTTSSSSSTSNHSLPINSCQLDANSNK